MPNNPVPAAIIMEVMETKERPINCAARNSVWAYPRATPPRFAGAPVIFEIARSHECPDNCISKEAHVAEKTMEQYQPMSRHHMAD